MLAQFSLLWFSLSRPSACYFGHSSVTPSLRCPTNDRGACKRLSQSIPQPAPFPFFDLQVWRMLFFSLPMIFISDLTHTLTKLTLGLGRIQLAIICSRLFDFLEITMALRMSDFLQLGLWWSPILPLMAAKIWTAFHSGPIAHNITNHRLSVTAGMGGWKLHAWSWLEWRFSPHAYKAKTDLNKLNVLKWRILSTVDLSRLDRQIGYWKGSPLLALYTIHWLMT